MANHTGKYVRAAGIAVAIFFSTHALADDDRDIEGTIQSIDQQARSFVIGDMTIYTDERTDYDDDLSRFSDLKTGQRVEVDYIMRDGKALAKEIELDE